MTVSYTHLDVYKRQQRALVGVQPRGHVVDDEVRERFGELAAVCLGFRERHALVEEVGCGAVLHQMARIVGKMCIRDRP